MKRLAHNVVVLTLVHGLVSAATIKTDHAPSVNFAQFKTYGWKAKPPPAEADPQGTFHKLDQLIKQTADQELDARGYVHDESKADFWLSYAVVADASSYLEPHFYPGFTTGHVEVYAQGNLVLEFLDDKGENVVWRAVAIGGVKPKAMDSRIPKIIKEMLQKFPPPASR